MHENTFMAGSQSIEKRRAIFSNPRENIEVFGKDMTRTVKSDNPEFMAGRNPGEMLKFEFYDQ